MFSFLVWDRVIADLCVSEDTGLASIRKMKTSDIKPEWQGKTLIWILYGESSHWGREKGKWQSPKEAANEETCISTYRQSATTHGLFMSN